MKTVFVNIPIVGGTIMITTACSELSNLSLWRSKEKLMIINSLFYEIRTDSGGNLSWSYYGKGLLEIDLSTAFDNINSNAAIGGNISWIYVNDKPNGDTLVENVLKMVYYFHLKEFLNHLVAKQWLIFKEM